MSSVLEEISSQEVREVRDCESFHLCYTGTKARPQELVCDLVTFPIESVRNEDLITPQFAHLLIFLDGLQLIEILALHIDLYHFLMLIEFG